MTQPAPAAFVAVALGVLALSSGAIMHYFTGLKSGLHQAFDEAFKTEYRKKFLTGCLEGDTSEGKTNYCGCLAEALLSSPLTKKQLMGNGQDAIDYMKSQNLTDHCNEVAARPAAEKTPELPAVDPAIEKLIESRPEIPKKAPLEEIFTHNDGEPDSILLANGQTMSCHIVERDKNGVWVEIGGGKVYFSNSEIKKIN